MLKDLGICYRFRHEWSGWQTLGDGTRHARKYYDYRCTAPKTGNIIALTPGAGYPAADGTAVVYITVQGIPRRRHATRRTPPPHPVTPTADTHGCVLLCRLSGWTRGTHICRTSAPADRVGTHARGRVFSDYAVSATRSRGPEGRCRGAMGHRRGQRDAPRRHPRLAEVLVGARRCRRCDVALPPRPGSGRPRVWAPVTTPDGQHDRAGVCAGCGVSIDGL